MTYYLIMCQNLYLNAGPVMPMTFWIPTERGQLAVYQLISMNLYVLITCF